MRSARGSSVPARAIAVIATAGVALLFAAGCSAETPPLIGISQIAAYSAARHAVPEATDTLSGKIARIRDIDPNQHVVPGETWVWAIVVTGSFPMSCGPAPTDSQPASSCPPPATTATVLLNYSTGAFIESMAISGK
jgi:hypothetical protein